MASLLLVLYQIRWFYFGRDCSRSSSYGSKVAAIGILSFAFPSVLRRSFLLISILVSAVKISFHMY